MIDAIGRARKGFQHQHSTQKVAPSGALPVTLTSDGAAWTLGNFSANLLEADFVTNPFDIHWLIIADPSDNATYEIVLYYGATDIECSRAKFTKSEKTVESISLPVQMKILPVGSRVRAKLMDSVGGSSLVMSMFYHEYEQE